MAFQPIKLKHLTAALIDCKPASLAHPLMQGASNKAWHFYSGEALTLHALGALIAVESSAENTP